MGHLGVSNWSQPWGDLKLSLQLSFFSSMHHKNAGDFLRFAVAGDQLETSLKCWSLHQNAGDFATMTCVWMGMYNNECFWVWTDFCDIQQHFVHIQYGVRMYLNTLC